jgi:hypothetical protein
MSTVQPRAKSLQDDPQTKLGGVVIWREMAGALHDKTRQGCDVMRCDAMMERWQSCHQPLAAAYTYVATASARSTATL